MTNKRHDQLTLVPSLDPEAIFPIVQDGGDFKAKVQFVLDLAPGGVSLSTTNVFSKNQSVAIVALVDGATISVDASLSNNFRVVLGGNRTLANPTNLTSGMVLNFLVYQDGTGSRTLAFGSKYKFFGSSSTISTAASAKDLISCIYDDTSDVLVCQLVKAAA